MFNVMYKGKVYRANRETEKCYVAYDISVGHEVYLLKEKCTKVVVVRDDEIALDWIGFMRRFERLALEKRLRVVMQRSSLGCGIQFYFREDNSKRYSRGLTWFYEKEPAVNFFDRLEAHADNFLKQLADEGASQITLFDFISEGGAEGKEANV